MSITYKVKSYDTVTPPLKRFREAKFCSQFILTSFITLSAENVCVNAESLALLQLQWLGLLMFADCFPLVTCWSWKCLRRDSVHRL